MNDELKKIIDSMKAENEVLAKENKPAKHNAAAFEGVVKTYQANNPVEEVKEDSQPDAAVTGEDTASNGEESSTDTEVETKETKIDNKYNFIDGVWTNTYKKPKLDNKGKQVITKKGEPEYDYVKSIIPKLEVPDKYIKENEKRIALKENKGGVLNFVFGEDDVDFVNNSVMDNYNSFLPSVDESKVISDNINSQILLYNQDQAKLKKLNDEVKSTTSVNANINQRQMIGPDGELQESYNQQAQKKAQEQTKIRQRILDGRTETENSIKNSRVSKFLSDAEKLWPKNEPKSKMTEMSIDTGEKDAGGNTIFTSWLKKTASGFL